MLKRRRGLLCWK